MFTSVFLLIQMILPQTSHMPDFVLILSLLYCKIFGGSALVLGRASEKEKNKSVKLVSREGKLF